MRKLVFILSFWCFGTTSFGQDLSVEDLLTLNTLQSPKFDQYLSKKGYSRSPGFSGETDVASWEIRKDKKKRKKEDITREVQRSQDDKINTLVFCTSSEKEFSQIRKRLKKEGFSCDADSLEVPVLPLVYRNRHIIIELNHRETEEDTLFMVRVKQPQLPEKVILNFAEDLLQFNSHLELIGIFGEENVKRDVYYITESLTKPCTILFPHTNRQVVFLWKDDSARADLSHIIFGGSLQANAALNYSSLVEENSWALTNGIHNNLNLRELIRINQGDFMFYGKRSPYFLSIVPETFTGFDLKGVTIGLGCYNCYSTAALDRVTISAQEALDNGLGMYVIMIMISKEEHGGRPSR